MSKHNFYFNGDKSKQIKAAGILFTKTDKNGEKYILVQEIEHNGTTFFADFGGKIEDNDIKVMDLVSRELLEESNNAFFRYNNKKKNYFNQKEISSYIYINKYKYFYIQKSKYFLYITNFTKDIKLDFNKVGLFEQLDKIKRKVKWVKISEYINNELHPRLWNKELNDYIKDMDNIMTKFSFSLKI